MGTTTHKRRYACPASHSIPTADFVPTTTSAPSAKITTILTSPLGSASSAPANSRGASPAQWTSASPAPEATSSETATATRATPLTQAAWSAKARPIAPDAWWRSTRKAGSARAAVNLTSIAKNARGRTCAWLATVKITTLDRDHVSCVTHSMRDAKLAARVQRKSHALAAKQILTIWRVTTAICVFYSIRIARPV
jgi:hypothetical protein